MRRANLLQFEFGIIVALSEMNQLNEIGGLVISLDLELYWGLRDVIGPASGYWENLRGEREAIKAILEVFEEFEIAATWATVGFLFARSETEVREFFPSVMPEYADGSLLPYREFESGSRPDDDFLFCPDLIEAIQRTPLQEVATHTFSHYYCCEPGQTREAFRADIESAVRAARVRGVDLKSIVFPRNQHNPEYDEILAENGITCYRGNQQAQMYKFGYRKSQSPIHRMSRLADTFINLSGTNTYTWDSVWSGRLANLPASAFLRPISSGQGVTAKMQHRRLTGALDEAARRHEIFHLWWHPHNFGAKLSETVSFLRRVLEHFSRLREETGIRSFAMAEAAEFARKKAQAAAV